VKTPKKLGFGSVNTKIREENLHSLGICRISVEKTIKNMGIGRLQEHSPNWDKPPRCTPPKGPNRRSNPPIHAVSGMQKHQAPYPREIHQSRNGGNIQETRFLEGSNQELGDGAAEGVRPVAARWGRARAPPPPPQPAPPSPSGEPQTTTWAHSQQPEGTEEGGLVGVFWVELEGGKNLCWAPAPASFSRKPGEKM
jgi:hypothetical protein